MNRKILRLAIPNIISNLTVPILSSVDTALMGHLDKVYYLGAIAVGGMIFNFIYWGFGFLRMGTTGLTAQSFGRQDINEGISILLRALIVSLFLGITLIAMKEVVMQVSFYLIDATEQVELASRRYFEIRIYAAPATLGLYAITGWFLGMQNAKYPMILAAFTNSMNIILNLVFVVQYKMNVEGVALGTVCASYLGLFVGLLMISRSYRGMLPFLKLKTVVDWQAFKEFFLVGRDIFIRTMILIFAFSFFTAKSAEGGDLILAANTILINLWTIMSYGIDGFAFAAESLVGRYVGARDIFHLKKTVRFSFIWGAGIGIFISVTYLIFPTQIIELFTNKAEVIQLALSLMLWTQLAPFFSSFCYIWDGIYIGATATKAMRNMMVISIAVFYLPLYYLSFPFIGYHALWLALSVFMIARGLTLTLLYKKVIIRQVLKNLPPS